MVDNSKQMNIDKLLKTEELSQLSTYAIKARRRGNPVPLPIHITKIVSAILVKEEGKGVYKLIYYTG